MARGTIASGLVFAVSSCSQEIYVGVTCTLILSGFSPVIRSARGVMSLGPRLNCRAISTLTFLWMRGLHVMTDCVWSAYKIRIGELTIATKDLGKYYLYRTALLKPNPNTS